jgi:acetolactate synthase I/II/III large subunit
MGRLIIDQSAGNPKDDHPRTKGPRVKAAYFIASFLKTQGITHVFELSGGMITHILDAIAEIKGIDIISVHHEQGAAFAADGMGRVTHKPGVALATSGPGATNLLTGIASCYFDSSPGLFITGQVNPNEQRGEKHIRQLGFQETDIVSMVQPIIKKAYRITSPDQLPGVLAEAYEIAMSGRPGPVLIDVPMDMQRAEIEPGEIPVIRRKKNTSTPLDDAFFSKLKRDLSKSKKPLILAGRGVRASACEKIFKTFVEEMNIPLVTSLMGIDLLPYEHPLRVGFIGSYGNRWANMAIGHSDMMIVIGSRLDIRQTGVNTKDFKGDRVIYHVDCEEGEINNRVLNCEKVLADAEDFLSAANAFFSKNKIPPTSYSGWLSELKELKKQWLDTNELKDRIKGINPNIFMHQLSKASAKARAFFSDVGNHQMWAAQSIELGPHQIFVTSGGMGAMGFALPASIGACLAMNKEPLVCIAGDGGFQLNIQELQTVVRNELPIKMVVLNNRCLGMIRQFQDSYFQGRYQSTFWGYNPPNFEAVAKAYTINSFTVNDESGIEEGLKQLWKNPNEPFLLQVMVDPHTNVYPKMAYGNPITEMEPSSKPTKIEPT